MRLSATLIAASLLVGAGGIGCSGDEETPTESPTQEPTPSATMTAAPTEAPTATAVQCIDEDQDGICSTTDCDDSAATVYPGADELCDGLDNDCDENTDEGLEATFYADADGDGYGVDDDTVTGACEAPAGYAAQGGDCDDTSRAVYPGRPDVCDEIDNDCDTSVDEDPNWTVYVDADGDGYGAAAGSAPGCAALEDETLVGGDCADDDAARHPGATEIWDNGVDEDCNSSDAKANLYVAKSAEDVPEGETPYPTIGAAISAAFAGATIAVGPGTYTETVNFNGADLHLVSMAGPEVTVIDAQGAGPVFLFTNGEGTSVAGASSVEGFTLTGGIGSPGSQCGFSVGFFYGGAVCIRDASPHFIGNYINNNTVAGSGGAIYVEGGTALFKGNFIENNTADYDAGAINISGSAAQFVDNVIANNKSKRTGGAFVVFESTSLIRNNVIALNNAAYERATPPQGGGIYVSDSDPVIRNNVIAYNQSGSSGGGIAVGNTGLAGLILNNTIVGNKADLGGGVNVNAGSIEMVNNIVAFNEAPTGANMEIADELGDIVTSRNLFWLSSGAAGVVGQTLDSTDAVGNPAFVNDRTDVNTLDDDFALTATSAAIDFGDPEAEEVDPDGTRLDAGAFGGTYGAAFSHSYAEAVGSK